MEKDIDVTWVCHDNEHERCSGTLSNTLGEVTWCKCTCHFLNMDGPHWTPDVWLRTIWEGGENR